MCVLRLSAAQKMQAAVGAPKGPNGMPTREQIAAAQVCRPSLHPFLPSFTSVALSGVFSIFAHRVDSVLRSMY